MNATNTWFNPIELNDAVGTIFSQNEIIALYQQDVSQPGTSVEIWRGMAWELPEEYKSCTNWRIFGSIRDSIDDSDIIEIELSK